ACAVVIILTLVIMALPKLSSLVLEENRSAMRIRKVLRPAVIAASAYLLFQPGWRAIGAFIFLAAFPYGAVRDVLRKRFSRAGQQGIRPAYRSRSRHFALANKAGEWLLRAFKHFAIWAVLA